MKRLTESQDCYYDVENNKKIRQLCYMGFDGDCKYPSCSNCTILKLYRKLAAYEDTGLDPEVIKKLDKRNDELYEKLSYYETAGNSKERVTRKWMPQKEAWDKYSIRCIQKLTAFEDLEEQGGLIKLPCKVGDEVYRITMGRDIESCNVEKILILSDGLYVAVFYKINKVGYISTYPVKELYFSREEAENALKGAEDEN